MPHFKAKSSSGLKLNVLFLWALIVVLPLAAVIPMTGRAENSFVRYQQPEFLTFDELRMLVDTEPPAGSALAKKLQKLWHTPIIDNRAYYEGAQPHRPTDPHLGPFLRVVSWNIEKSLEMPRAIKLFTATPEEFAVMVDPDKAKPGSKEFKYILRQQKRLLEADVVILEEMDIGVKRSGYINAAEELAKALKMNYAYAPAYLEIDPVVLGLEKIRFDDGDVDEEATRYFTADPKKYKGLFGSAVLSRYPIKRIDVWPLKYQPYDWHGDEMKSFGFTEKARRKGTEWIFKNEITRELKVGGRNYFRVDLDVPGFPNNTLTVINIHLEIKCQPKDRKKQMKEILGYIKPIKNALIMMGDYNAAPTDISPTSLKRIAARTAKNPTTWLSLGLQAVAPQATLLNVTRGVSNVTKNLNNPFAKNIPIIAPNKVKAMFEAIKNFEFDDDSTFDFRGDEERSINGKDKILANSNERGFKGFETTFSVKRALGFIGKFRLDWVFVKSGLLKDIDDEEASYRYAPHFGETLEEMHTSLKEPISDHHPNVVDLPFNEPRIDSD